MAEYTAYPLSWPLSWKRNKTPQRSRFGTFYNKPSVAKGRDAVIHEVFVMGCPSYNVVISSNLPLKRDGLPYSNQKEPTDTGVAVFFRIDGKPTVLACDKWNTVGDNLWAIARHVEALRGQDRWGVGSLAQAFAGYVALNEKTEATCWEILEIASNATEPQIMDAYRRKARETHPDKEGGSSELFSAVVRAKDIALSAHKNGAR
jgi:hypothetical protein